MDVMRGAPGRHVQVTVGYGLWRQINEMSALLRSDDDDQDEGHRERNDRIWVGLSAMWRGHRFPDRCSSSMAFGAAGDLGPFGRRSLLGGMRPPVFRLWENRPGGAVGGAQCDPAEREVPAGGVADRVGGHHAGYVTKRS